MCYMLPCWLFTAYAIYLWYSYPFIQTLESISTLLRTHCLAFSVRRNVCSDGMVNSTPPTELSDSPSFRDAPLLPSSYLIMLLCS